MARPKPLPAEPVASPERPFPDASAAWRYLAQVTDYERMNRFGRGRAQWDLNTVTYLLAALDHPDRAYRIVHIVGTKGKGTTAYLIAAALQGAGYRTGLYVSPHVDSPWERIQVDGSSLPKALFVDLMNSLHPALAGAPRQPTFFEIFTVLGLAAFRAAQVEVAVVEAGLGGRWDATNAVTRPAVTVITSVSRDHVHLLGQTVAAIAREKAAVIRPGVPVVCGVRPGEAGFPAVAAAARRAGAPLWVRQRDFRLLAYRPCGAAAEVDLAAPEGSLRGLRLALWGPCHGQNAALAWAGLQALARSEGLLARPSAVRAAWAQTRPPGRLELLQAEPHLLVVDGAHNAASALAALAALHWHFPERPLHLVLAIRDDKLLEETALPLFRAAATAHVAPLSRAPAADPEHLAALGRRVCPSVTAYPSVRAALAGAEEAAARGDIVFATGSLYLAGEIRALRRHTRSQAGPVPFR